MKFCMSGHGQSDKLLSPIRIIVRMLKPENMKVEDLSTLELGVRLKLRVRVGLRLRLERQRLQ